MLHCTSTMEFIWFAIIGNNGYGNYDALIGIYQSVNGSVS